MPFPFIVFVTALVDSINPCAISVLLITIAFLFSVGKERKRILEIGGTYIASIYLVYLLIGLGIIRVLSFFNVSHSVTRTGAAILIAWAVISLLNDFFPRFPIRLEIPKFAKGAIARWMSKSSVPAAIVLGALVGITEFPCTGGPYLFILSMLHDRATALSGFLYLLFYNFVFVLPLIVILVVASHKSLLGKVNEWKTNKSRTFGIVGSLVMIALGLAIFFFS